MNNDAAVGQQKIANAGEAFGVHEVRRGFQQTHARPLFRAPFQKRTRAAGQIGLEIVERLLAAVAREGDLHAFRRAFQVGGVVNIFCKMAVCIGNRFGCSSGIICGWIHRKDHILQLSRRLRLLKQFFMLNYKLILFM